MRWWFTIAVPKRELASLKGGLLRLTMAGLVWLFFRTADYWTQFIITEAAILLLTIAKEAVRMAKGRFEITVCVRSQMDRSVQEAPLAYRQSLLMSS